MPSNNSCDNFFNLILKWHHIKERLTHNPHRRLFLFFLIYRPSEWAYKTFVIKFIAFFFFFFLFNATQRTAIHNFLLLKLEKLFCCSSSTWIFLRLCHYINVPTKFTMKELMGILPFCCAYNRNDETEERVEHFSLRIKFECQAI